MPDSAAGITSARRWSISCEVCTDSGEVVGVTVTTPTVAPVFIGIAVTLATPLRVLSSFVRVVSAAWSALVGAWATRVSGPLKPGPKPSASRSYALRVVVEAGSLPWSEEPRRSERVGMDSASITSRAAPASSFGRRSTVPAHLLQTPPEPVASAPSSFSLRR